jgi:hypothetical protein
MQASGVGDIQNLNITDAKIINNGIDRGGHTFKRNTNNPNQFIVHGYQQGNIDWNSALIEINFVDGYLEAIVIATARVDSWANDSVWGGGGYSVTFYAGGKVSTAETIYGIGVKDVTFIMS